MIVVVDPGHGGNDPGAVYKGRKESDDNLMLSRAVAKELRRHGVAVDETRTEDKTVSLNERSNLENSGAYDYFISFHRNAFKPEQARGVETYIHTNAAATAKQLAGKLQAALADIGFVNRGIKTANFHVLRETKAPAILVEVGFIDNTSDNQLFDNKRDEIVEVVTKAVLEQSGIKYIPTVISPPKQQAGQVLYRVMAGSYAVRANAEGQVERLKKAGFDAVIMPYKA